MKQKIWLIFNLKNEQNDYAALMQLLEGIEEHIYKENIEFILKPEDVLIYRNRNHYSDKTKLIADIEQSIENNDLRTVRDFYDLIRSSENYDFHYYARIESGDETDIVNLQYFILMLQNLEISKEHIISYIHSNHAEDIFRFSDFITLLPEKYQMFYAKDQISDGINFSYSRIGRKKSQVQKTFVPLLEINQSTYNLFANQLKFTKDLKGIQSNRKEDYLEAMIRANPIETLAYDMLKTANRIIAVFLGNNIRTREKKEYIIRKIVDVVDEVGGVTPLEYVTFSIFVESMTELDTSNENLKWKYVLECMNDAKSLTSSIMQILENVVFHSQKHKGCFTLRIHNKDTYIHKNYPGYDSTNEKVLELMVSDSNRSNDIISTFIETPGKATSALIECRDKISLSDFMGEYENGNVAEAWKQMRSKYPARCLGLLRFSNMLNIKGAAVRICSSNSYNVTDVNFLYRNYRNCYYNDNNELRQNYYMPGTQFSVAIGIGKKQREPRFDFDVPYSENSVFYENYEVYSRFLDYNAQDASCWFDCSSDKIKEIMSEPIKTQNNKDILIDKIGRIISEFFNKKMQFYVFDVSDLCIKDKSAYIEPFVKATILWKNKSTVNDIHIIILNANTDFINQFFYTVCSNNYILSGKGAKFYLLNGSVEKTDSALWIPIVGQSVEEVVENIQDYSSRQSNVGYLVGNKKTNKTKVDKIYTLPVDLMIKIGDDSLFERKVKSWADQEISKVGKRGYKIENTHMRLGNKVHIDTFYEISIMFQHQDVAMKTAFLFLKRLIGDETFLENTDKLIFYGYASYSRAILSAITGILNEYLIKRNIKDIEIEYIIYQNDLAIETTSSKVQMYFSNKDCTIDNKTKIIQVVPISSSLTTFNKMWSELKQRKQIKSDGNLYANMTAFWVKNVPTNGQETASTTLEKPYWESFDPKSKQINTQASIKPNPSYLVYGFSRWNDPLMCIKCFPDNPVMEIPLVETDPTSTIPSQQLYLCENISNSAIPKIELYQNDKKISRLEDCVRYGHVIRGNNHFQYYINMLKYFQKEKKDIEKWLNELDNKDSVSRDVINIIVSPQQPSNVEFVQSVL